MFSDELPDDHRSGYIALIGKPNVGKSTLLNAWLGTKIAPVSAKPQTTRNQLLGILTREHVQAIFVDTPGMHLPRTELGEYMVKTAQRAIPDADVLLFMVDLGTPPTKADRETAKLFDRLRTPVVLAMNKVDLVAEEDREERFQQYSELGGFAHVQAISALEGQGVPELLEEVIARLPFGPRYYPEDQLSDQQQRFIASELIREQLLKALSKEVPHALAVIVDEFLEPEEGPIRISAFIYCEKDSQKGIVIGRQGSMLKRVGSQARAQLEDLLQRQVYLELWVKVRKNWRRDRRLLRQFGYDVREAD